MNKLKSGIILENGIVIMPRENENRDNRTLLKDLGIQDVVHGKPIELVEAALIPENDEWWVSPKEHPEKWEFVVDQDITPEWLDKEKVEKSFREAVYGWWKSRVLVNQKIDELNSGYYRLKCCEVKRLCKDVKVVIDDSQIDEMNESSQIIMMSGNSKVEKMFGNAYVCKMRENSKILQMQQDSKVEAMLDNSQIGRMSGSARVNKMCGNSKILEMDEDSYVEEMQENPLICLMRSKSRVNKMLGNSMIDEMRKDSHVYEMLESSKIITMRDNAQVSRMYENSKVVEILEQSTAIDYRNFPEIKILVGLGVHLT